MMVDDGRNKIRGLGGDVSWKLTGSYAMLKLDQGALF